MNKVIVRYSSGEGHAPCGIKKGVSFIVGDIKVPMNVAKACADRMNANKKRARALFHKHLRPLFDANLKLWAELKQHPESEVKDGS